MKILKDISNNNKFYLCLFVIYDFSKYFLLGRNYLFKIILKISASRISEKYNFV